ncbi:MAG: S-layer homology domain-containing protein, partial [Clostridiales bacterium]|nr:S-layer homology domain-containing protein [Clostridiales bacterium]
VALNGGKEPTLSVPATPTFKDVRNDANSAWAEKYIESCVAQGIVGGVGNGMFQPSQNVTGSQLAKMLLVALGYKSDIEGFGGTAWDTNVNVLATQKGLYDELENIDVSAALTRDSAAQMIWNALQAVVVEYKYTLDGSNGQLTSKADVVNKTHSVNGTDVDTTLLYDRFDRAQEVDGRLVGFTYDSNKGEWTYSLAKRGSNDSAGTFTSKDDYTELYMQNVTAVFNYENKKDSTKVDKFYGMYADETVVLATGIVGDLGAVTGDAKKVKLDGTEYKAEKALNSIPVYAFNNGVYTIANLNALVSDKNNNAATSIKLIDLDNNSKVDLVVVVPTIVKEVTYVGTTRVTAGESYKFEDCNIYKDIAKDDFAVIVKAAYTAKDEDTLTKAETVKGEVTGLRSGEVRVDGTWYTLTGGAKAPEVGDTVQLAVVGDFAYDVDTTVGASKDILFISMADPADSDLSNDYTIDARAYFPDGTNQKITVDKLEGKDIASTTTLNTMVMYTYSVDKDGNYELKAVAKTNLAGADDFVTGAYSATNDTIDSKKISDDAVIFVIATTTVDSKTTINDVDVVSGKSVKDWSTSTAANVKGALVDEINSMNYVTYAALEINSKDADNPATIPNADGDMLYAYLLKNSYTTKKDGDTVTAFEVWNGKENVTLYEDSTAHKNIGEGQAIAYKLDGDFITYQGVLAPYAIVGFDGKAEGDIELQAVGGKTTPYTLDKDCVILAVDDAAVEGEEGSISDVSLAQKDVDGKYIPNAYVAIVDGEVVAIVYDVSGELDEVLTADEIQNTIDSVADEVKAMNAADVASLIEDTGFAGLDKEIATGVKVSPATKTGENAYTVDLIGTYTKSTEDVAYPGFTTEKKNAGYIICVNFPAPEGTKNVDMTMNNGTTKTNVADTDGSLTLFQFVKFETKTFNVTLQWKDASGNNFGKPVVYTFTNSATEATK